ncbi:hypothetical protein IQ230_19335 [Gloeocapsopsis crepidinum LEGE 06123]|uniref:Uncharacterized protein n=1 Tax=Gloeocapsopsis crepidinum LEGE 06123 TaxID=588587 RepID=A0ABR9UW24_9CHRO|nr:hypothetical protein [Gloeocapsopsis crepidinum]MBE9192461.1 hypothetical protein [Gloeocapsopsis crepidinum LEGE 06123]
MTFENQGKKQQQDIDLFFFSLSPQVLLQIGTGPVLLAMLGLRAYSELIESVGQSAEEILRGDRLPLLPFPEPQKTPQIE